MQSFRPEQEGSTREDGHATTATVLQAGTEWLVDAAGCDPRQLSDLRHLQDICAELVDALRLRVIGAPLWHQFPSLGADDAAGRRDRTLLAGRVAFDLPHLPRAGPSGIQLILLPATTGLGLGGLSRSALGSHPRRCRDPFRGAGGTERLPVRGAAMKVAHCPSCGGLIEFHVSSSLVTICEHCHSAIARGDKAARRCRQGRRPRRVANRLCEWG